VKLHAARVRRLGACLAAVAAVLIARAAGAQEPEDRLFVEHADQTQRLTQGDSVSYYLDGNVRIRRGDLRITAQHAVVLEWIGVVDLSRDVHLWDPEQELYSDHLTYTDSIDVAVATGNVQLVDRESQSQLRSGQVVYDRPRGILTATGEPEMILLPDDPEREAEAAEEDSVVPVHVWSRQVVRTESPEEVVATGEVLVKRGEELTARADTLRAPADRDVLELRGGPPRVETGRFLVEGGEVDVLLRDDRIAGLLARGEARASSSADSIPARAVEELGDASPGSWLAGDTLRIAFEEGEIRSVTAVGEAKSLTYALESRSEEAATWALSYLLAGEIALHFDAQAEDVHRVEASERGRGLYRTAAIAGPEGQPVPQGERAGDGAEEADETEGVNGADGADGGGDAAGEGETDDAKGANGAEGVNRADEATGAAAADPESAAGGPAR
jgi:lipopolysaccharide export system protein LptA